MNDLPPFPIEDAIHWPDYVLGKFLFGYCAEDFAIQYGIRVPGDMSFHESAERFQNAVLEAETETARNAALEKALSMQG